MNLIETFDNPCPPGAIVAAIVTSDKVTLRVARWQPAGACIGTILIAGGRGEFIEKYFEVVAQLLARGLHVVAFDWRGQGLSARPLANPRKGHIADFAHFGRDLAAVDAQVLQKFCPKPWFGLGHSMGGAIFLAQSSALQFERMVLSAPMIGLAGVKYPKLLPAVIGFLASIGFATSFVPGGGATAYMTRPFAGNVLTSDANRYARIAAIVAAEPRLAIGAPTIGWLNAAQRLMRQFAEPGYGLSVAIPTLIVAAGADQVVDTAASERLGLFLKAGRTLVVTAAAHEILIERDIFRAQFWAAFDAFIPGTRAELQAVSEPI